MWARFIQWLTGYPSLEPQPEDLRTPALSSILRDIDEQLALERAQQAVNEAMARNLVKGEVAKLRKEGLL